MQKKNINNNKMIANSKSILYYLPIIFTIVVIPLIVHGKIIELPLEVANYWRGGTTHVDFFNYYKYITLIISTIFATLIFLGLIADKKITLLKEKRYYILMVIYMIFAIISTIMSHNKFVAFNGFMEMNQGIFVLLSYITLSFILLNFISKELEIKIVVYSFIILTIVEGLLGIFQYAGYDFFQTYIGKLIMLPTVLRNTDVKFVFGAYTIYGTMYNTNFVGSFASLILPLTISLYLYSKDRKKTIIFGIAALFAFILWIGCNSRAGYLGISTTFILWIIMYRKVFLNKYKKMVILLCLFIIILLTFNTISNGRVFNQFSRLNPKLEADKFDDIQTKNVRFEDVSIIDNSLILKTNNNFLKIVVRDNVMNFYDDNNNILEVNIENNGNVRIQDEDYSGFEFQITSSKIIANIYDRRLNLYVSDKGELKVISNNNMLTTPIEAPRIKLFDGRETFASHRGYIWSRTIPMLKDTLIIGYGPDNYPMVFPQEDYVGRFNVGNEGMLNIIIDKPHNMYLQTAINTGVISLLALMAIWGIYLFDSLKIYLKGNIESFTEYMGAATFLSITAYLVAGLFNDSVISVAPLFWILLGMGIGINRMIRDKNVLTK